MNVTLFGQRVFADIIRDFEIILHYLVRPYISSQGSLQEKGRGRFHTRRGDSVTTEAEEGVMWPQAKGCSEAPAAAKAMEQILPEGFGGGPTLQTP